MGTKSREFGWRPDKPDQRDYRYAIAAPIVLPPNVDLRPQCPTVYDQGQLGSCTGNSIAGAIQFELMKQNTDVFTPSRLFIYYNERVMENTVKSDAGAEIRDGIKSVATLGVCTELEWPYKVTQFTTKPSAKCFKDAKKDVVSQYLRLDNTSLNDLKTCLAQGYPFVLGFSVYESFESATVAKTGVVNMPKKKEKMLGGHAVCCVGYNDKTQRFIVRNSWGSGWGQAGYFTIPYAYLTNSNLSDDFWTIRLVN